MCQRASLTTSKQSEHIHLSAHSVSSRECILNYKQLLSDFEDEIYYWERMTLLPFPASSLVAARHGDCKQKMAGPHNGWSSQCATPSILSLTTRLLRIHSSFILCFLQCTASFFAAKVRSFLLFVLFSFSSSSRSFTQIPVLIYTHFGVVILANIVTVYCKLIQVN